MSTVSKIIAVAFIASCIAVVASRMINADWSSKPSRQELENAQKKIWVPPSSRVVASDNISKLTFSGYSSTIRSTSDFAVSVEQYERSANEQGWLAKQKSKRPDHYRAIYCMDDIAQDIEIAPATSGVGVVINAGSYWAADRGDSRFCRKQ